MNTRWQILNAMPSVLWTALLLGPVSLFCTRHLSLLCIACFVVAGVASMLPPKAFLRRLALSSTRSTYENFRVGLLIKVTQDAGWLRRAAGVTEPRARHNQQVLGKIVGDTWMRERFHLGLFTFCVLCSAVALRERRVCWLVALLLINALYNLYPMWLQQYLRLRIARCQTRFAP